jgi:hypothetical protein
MLPWVQAVHAVECSEQGGLAASRGADESSHSILLNIEIDLFQSLEFSVIEIKVFNFNGIFGCGFNHKFPA